MLNSVNLMGRLVADPELRQTQTGLAVCSFRIAVDRNHLNANKERETDFIDIVAWRKTAEFVTQYFVKGAMIIVQGSIQTRNYEDKNGNKRIAVEVVADSVLFGEKKQNPAGAPTPQYGSQPAQPQQYAQPPQYAPQPAPYGAAPQQYAPQPQAYTPQPTYQPQQQYAPQLVQQQAPPQPPISYASGNFSGYDEMGDSGDLPF